MNIQQIKSELSIPSLQLNVSLDADRKPTEWLRHWENDSRTAVSLHKDTFQKIKENPAMDNLGLQKGTGEAEQGKYTTYRIVAYTPAEFTL